VDWKLRRLRFLYVFGGVACGCAQSKAATHVTLNCRRLYNVAGLLRPA
jgi:hypothetical protein